MWGFLHRSHIIPRQSQLGVVSPPLLQESGIPEVNIICEKVALIYDFAMLLAALIKARGPSML